MSLKLTISSVSNIIESYGCKLLSNEYKNTNTILEMRCKCGTTMNRTLNNFKTSKHKCCNDCAKKIKFDKLRYSINDVKNKIEATGCKLINNEYVNANSEISILYTCGHESKTTLARFTTFNSKVCYKCSKKNGAKKRAHSFEVVKNYIEINSCKLISSEYINANTPLILQCKCGNNWKTDFHTFKRSKHKSCKICSAAEGGKKISGVNNYFYGKIGPLNHNYNKNNIKKIFAKRFASKEYRDIREKVILRDNHTCKKCGYIARFKKEKNSFQIHHLFNKSKYPKWFFRMSNLITLCGACHKNFHIAYGKFNNTPKQMKAYLQKVKI